MTDSKRPEVAIERWPFEARNPLPKDGNYPIEEALGAPSTPEGHKFSQLAPRPHTWACVLSKPTKLSGADGVARRPGRNGHFPRSALNNWWNGERQRGIQQSLKPYA